MASFTSAIPYIKISEGNLSRAKTDSASANPAPWLYNGYSDWHTNKGVTYTTFKGLAPSLGYAVTASNFFNMPDSIWLKIYKKGYWDAMYCSLYNSQAIADLVVDWAWASGVTGATRLLTRFLSTYYKVTATTPAAIATAINKLNVGTSILFNQMVDFRKKVLLEIPGTANDAGWMKRMEALRVHGMEILRDHKWGILITVTVLAGTLYGIIKLKEHYKIK